MIKININTMRAPWEEIQRLYLYMVARVVPFYPQDVLFEGFFYPDGKTKTDIKKFSRLARKRNAKFEAIYKAGSARKTKQERERITALMAEEIIRDNIPSLHHFLYEGMTDGHVVPERLRLLFTLSFTSEGLWDLAKACLLSPIKNEEEKCFPRAVNHNDLLEYVFRYDAFSKLDEIHSFVNLLGVEVCPYCNRVFTTTLDVETKKLRPQLDHYLCKSRYPYFALSIKNLVPSCGVCNLSKHENEGRLLYPYEEEMGDEYVFEADSKKDLTVLTGTGINEEDILILLKQKQQGIVSERTSRIEASISTLALDELYQSHKGYVVELLRQRYVFSDEMIREIASQYPDLFKSEIEVREMLLLNKLRQEDLGQRPLGKLTHDILEELNSKYQKK